MNRLMWRFRNQATYETTVVDVADEPELIQFLLGKLPDEGHARIEERIFKDDEFFERLCALEEEIVRDYLRRELPTDQEAAFEARLAVSPDLLRRVESARALMVTLGLPSVPGPRVPVAGQRPWWAGILTFPQPAYGLAWIFVAVIALVASMWFGFENRRLRTQLAGYIRNTAAPPIVFSFMLTPGGTMGPRDVPARLLIPLDTASVHLDLEVRTPASYREFRAELRELDRGVQSWSGPALPARSSVAGVIVSLEIPASGFGDGDYILLLKGLTAAGRWEDLPSYSFGVVRR